MNAEQLTHLRAIITEMSPRPWIAVVNLADRPESDTRAPAIISSDRTQILADVWGGEKRGANCYGIACLANHATELLDELEKLRAQVERLSKAYLEEHRRCTWYERAVVHPDRAQYSDEVMKAKAAESLEKILEGP